MRKNGFFKGMNFDPKGISIILLLGSLLFLGLFIKSFHAYRDYMNNQVGYSELFDINGEIINDKRNPPGRYNERLDGIYVKTKNGNINIYCDNVKNPSVGYGSRGGGLYAPGRCDWIAVQRSRQGFCSSKPKILCENPRLFFGDVVTAKVDNNMTIYELLINDQVFYTYDEMKDLYRDKYLSSVRFDFFIFVLSFLLGVIFFLMYKKVKQA